MNPLRRRKILWAAFLAGTLWALWRIWALPLSVPWGAGDPEAVVRQVRLPPGFRMSLYARVPGARSLALGASGTLFVGTRGMKDHVYAVRDEDGDGVGEKVTTVITNRCMPNGVAFRNGALYVAEVERIVRFDEIEANLATPPEPVVIREDFPNIVHHGWKYLRFSPDGRLYVPVGAPCNVCDEQDPRFASILRLDPDGKNLEVFARGVRNTVGFDWHPETRELWFTENGRDWMGEDLPPDELNLAPRMGLHFGFPYFHGPGLRDPEFGGDRDPADFIPPVQSLGAHVAAIGMRFYTGSRFPGPWRNRIFIAEHGSWNRRQKAGYRITTVTLEGARATGYEAFAEGFLAGDRVLGRPVDLEITPDGDLLVSDDFAGAVYRITWDPR